MELVVRDNPEKKRYEANVDGEFAIIEYIKAKDTIYLTHTEVPKSMEGKGIGSRLVVAALEDIERQNLMLAPLCPFVAAYIKRHPEWKRILSPKYNV
ncbi:N-acetyltransferase [Winogradskyella sp. 3972H.M.0a.05]|uniref:GNAT family N-acetyltransferase n=1 Tax=Winogradskyella sp. 3972H.M.0a.05 TaxID=2950277 RepID=UPI003393ABF2